MLASVVVAYRLPQKLVDSFFNNNPLLMEATRLYMVTNAEVPSGVIKIACPEMDVFSISRAANLGIRAAINSGAEAVLKTDIDCIVTSTALLEAQEVTNKRGVFWRYWNINSLDRLDTMRMARRKAGTICLSAGTWKQLCGYDERMSGYGHDDGDLIARARTAGVKLTRVITPSLFHIRHKQHNQHINPESRKTNQAISKTPWDNTSWGTKTPEPAQISTLTP